MTAINRSDIYDKNLNFLIGSGASVGLLPTLALGVKDSKTSKGHTLETLATHFEDSESIMCLLFSYYVENVIGPASCFSSYGKLKPEQGEVMRNYFRFISTILHLLNKKAGQRGPISLPPTTMALSRTVRSA